MEKESLSHHVIQRASALEHVMSRVDLAADVLARQEATGKDLTLNWISPDATKQTPPEKLGIIFDANLIRGMKKVAATLYGDLRDEGEVELARDIVEQARLDNDRLHEPSGPLLALPERTS